MSAEVPGPQEGQEPVVLIEDQIAIPPEIDKVIKEIGNGGMLERDVALRDKLQAYAKAKIMLSYLRRMGETRGQAELSERSSRLYSEITETGQGDGIKAMVVIHMVEGQTQDLKKDDNQG